MRWLAASRLSRSCRHNQVVDREDREDQVAGRKRVSVLGKGQAFAAEVRTSHREWHPTIKVVTNQEIVIRIRPMEKAERRKAAPANDLVQELAVVTVANACRGVVRVKDAGDTPGADPRIAAVHVLAGHQEVEAIRLAEDTLVPRDSLDGLAVTGAGTGAVMVADRDVADSAGVRHDSAGLVPSVVHAIAYSTDIHLAVDSRETDFPDLVQQNLTRDSAGCLVEIQRDGGMEWVCLADIPGLLDLDQVADRESPRQTVGCQGSLIGPALTA